MGEVSRSRSENRFRIVGGRLSKKVDKDFPGAVARTYEESDTKEVKTVYERYIDSWNGKIVSLTRVLGGKYGEQLIVGMNDGEESMDLEMPIDSGYALDFMKRYLSKDYNPAIDVLVTPIQIEENKKKKYYFSLTQGEVKIKSPFTKEYQENPNNKFRMPDWVSFQAGPGKIGYNKTPQIDFLWTYCVQKSLNSDPMFQARVTSTGNTSAAAPSTPPVTAQPTINYGTTPAAGTPAYNQQREAAMAGAPLVQPPVYQPPVTPPQQPTWDPSAIGDDLPF